MKIRNIIMTTVLMLGGFVSAQAQDVTDSTEVKSEVKPKREFDRWGVCLDGSTMFNGFSTQTMIGWGLQGCYRFNTNFNVGLGLRMLYWEGCSESWHDNKYYYVFKKETDDDGKSSWRRQLDIVASATYILPVIKRGGIALGGTVLVSPIPSESFDISRTLITGSDESSHYYRFTDATESKHKHVYDGFQPGLFAEAGIYYDINEYGTKYRFTLMYGVGTFDLFRGSRNSTVFDQKLRDHLPERELYHSLTLRLTVF
jgi:hypothetical protein